MKSPQITWINSDDPPDAFPDINSAFDIPDGLLAAGGDLSPERLLYAYSHGIFPWYSEGQPILWWSPDPRCVIPPDELHISRRLGRDFSKSDFQATFNKAFDDVISCCAADRPGQDGTWITPEMHQAYRHLHANGWAHSVEIWRGDKLAGGLYGIAIDRVFFGESMFSAESNASKAALLALCQTLRQHQFALLDCQVESPHLLSLGARLMPRQDFSMTLESSCTDLVPFDSWPTERLGINEFRR